MKKISIILAALAACFAVSCTKEAPTTEPQDPSAPAGMKKVTITATAEGATKTTYTDNGEGRGVFSWTKGDQISLLATDNQLYTFIAETSGTATNFAGYIPEGESVGRFAYFPASENHTYTTDWWSQYSIDEYKDMNGLASAEIPMYGLKGEDDSYTFTHLTGAVQFTFTNIPDGLDEVEISIKNEQCKFSGLWRVSTSDWGWSAAYTTNDSELTFTRVVPVKNNSAQLYLPYNGGIWYNSILNIKALDASGNEMILLKDKNVKGNGTPIERAQIVPYAPLALPAYVPSVDWTKVDWETDNVVTSIVDPSASYSTIKEMKVIADKYYVYVRLNASSAISFVDENGAANKYLDVYMSNGEVGDGSFQIYSSRWTTSGTVNYYNDAYTTDGIVVGARWEHAGEFDADGNLTKMRFYLPDDVSRDDIKDMKTEVVGEDIYWYIAYPRANVDYYKSSDNHLYISFMMWEGWNTFGVIPTKGAEMLEVTLP